MDTASGLGPSHALDAVRARIAERFGLVPSFFMMARAEPPIVEAMYDMVEFAYFDSPLPRLFKERLFTYVSRFCSVPYCMARHCAFLLGHGNVAGDPTIGGISVEEAMVLLGTPFPDAARRDELLVCLQSVDNELDHWPDASSDLANTVFFAAAVAFVLPQEHRPLLAELERVLGARRYHYLMLFLGFIRFAHFWTESHPQLHFEGDIETLFAEQRALAKWVTSYQPRVEAEVANAKAELRELEWLRARSRQSDQTIAELRDAVAAGTLAIRAADADNRAKATVMATLNHELQTPLNAVIGYTELLEAGMGGPLQDQAADYIARIKAMARHQQQIIEQLLSFAHSLAGTPVPADDSP